tara:strand:- start:23879 stop:25018 length:1140 start_codon:yes stop_codon:yes gene_type:complete
LRQTRRKFLVQSALGIGAMPFLAAKIRASAIISSGLAEVFKDDFHLGTAISDATLKSDDSTLLNLIAREFNTITAENAMKWEGLQPSVNQFSWKLADDFVNFGRKNNMLTVGHTLVWHSQTPDYVFKNKASPASREILLKRMQHHIGTVIDRYKDSVAVWDVVNEAIEQGKWRRSEWLKIIGEEYFGKAFAFARDADPTAHLIYNDYNMHNPDKQNFVISQVNKCKKMGITVDGVGMECHATLDEGPPVNEIETAIVNFARAGLKVHISELDVDVLPSAWDYQGAEIDVNYDYSEKINPFKNALPRIVSAKLAERYRELFELFVKHRDKITRVSFWGTTDDESWKNDWPVEGRTNYPLLFDRSRSPKDAYFAVRNLKSQ